MFSGWTSMIHAQDFADFTNYHVLKGSLASWLGHGVARTRNASGELMLHIFPSSGPVSASLNLGKGQSEIHVASEPTTMR